MDKKEDGHRIWSRTKWTKSRQRTNKYFFSFVKEQPVGGLLTKLYDEDDTNVSLRVLQGLQHFLLQYPMNNRRKFVRNYQVMSHVNSHLKLRGCWRFLSRKNNSPGRLRLLRKEKTIRETLRPQQAPKFFEGSALFGGLHA